VQAQHGGLGPIVTATISTAAAFAFSDLHRADRVRIEGVEVLLAAASRRSS
jgi:hypothetical protein